MYPLIKHYLFQKDPEEAHEFVFHWVEKAMRFPWVLEGIQALMEYEHPVLQSQLWGKDFKNPIGLAAGFDKDARIINALFALGFGFVEVGTVTPRPQEGNPKPRIFRLKEDHALINRLGFNNRGMLALEEQLKKEEAFPEKLAGQSKILGINLGKNKDTIMEDAALDYTKALKLLYPYAGYFTVNISSPNTKNLRDLQESSALRELLSALFECRESLVQTHVHEVPIALKIAPDLDTASLDSMIPVLQEFPLAAIIATNTTLKRPQLKSLDAQETGGLSGAPLKSFSTCLIKTLYQALGSSIPIIGVGGVSNGADAFEKIKAGASLIQIYTGLVYQGPGMIRQIKQELAELLTQEGYTSLHDAIGAEAH